jgi:peptide/nickel transport system permease protein
MKPYKLYLVLVAASSIVYRIMGWRTHMEPTGYSLEAPSFMHLLGTDDLGIDILAQLCYGAGNSLFIGCLAAGLSVGLGIIIGILAGYLGGKTDAVLMGICDIITSMPQMILLILLGVFLGSGYTTLVIVLGFMSWTQTARMIRARVLFIKKSNYILYSKSYGASIWYLIKNHFTPALKDLVIFSFLKLMSRSIIMEASLAYLGISDPTSKSWGMMLNRGMSFSGIYFTEFWKWWVLSPLIALIALILSIMLVSREFELEGKVDRSIYYVKVVRIKGFINSILYFWRKSGKGISTTNNKR